MADTNPDSDDLPGRLDLDTLAGDVADLLDRGNYGIHVSQDDIRPALPAFLAAIMENAVTGGTG